MLLIMSSQILLSQTLKQEQKGSLMEADSKWMKKYTQGKNSWVQDKRLQLYVNELSKCYFHEV